MKRWIVAGLVLPFLAGCLDGGSSSANPRLVLFVGMDVSGSFLDGKHFDDSVAFTARYLHAHLNGLGGLEKPHSLFVGSIGGAKKDEPKTFFPIQSFEGSSVEEIEKKLREIFPKQKANPFTDFNAYFEQVADTVKNKKLLLKPLSVVMITDGKPDLGGKDKHTRFRGIDLAPLEQLSRNVTVRVLYTDAVTAKSWTTEVPRKRVKVWTQDAVVMAEWKSPKTYVPGREPASQGKFFSWLKDNVDFPARVQRVE